ncbi:MAG: GDSL-type esterase/lipase family protein [Sporichthyaceae bacterium]
MRSAVGAALLGVAVASAPAVASAEEAVALPTSLAALGDSITAGFNACGFFADCPTRSWSAGSDSSVYSHRQRLADAGARLAEANNLARTGARVEALPGQMAAAVAAGADYVTVEIGANDACRRDPAAMTSVPAYRASVREAFGTLKKERPEARLFVASIPDLHRLWEVGHGSRLARMAWKKLGICQAMLARPTSKAQADAARRASVRERVQAYNAELAMACADYGTRCRYDGGTVFAYRFSLNQLTRWDFFHPDKGGQRALSDATWRAGFWG